jgi:hypothetical protein
VLGLIANSSGCERVSNQFCPPDSHEARLVTAFAPEPDEALDPTSPSVQLAAAMRARIAEERMTYLIERPIRRKVSKRHARAKAPWTDPDSVYLQPPRAVNSL